MVTKKIIGKDKVLGQVLGCNVNQQDGGLIGSWNVTNVFDTEISGTMKISHDQTTKHLTRI